MIAVLIVSFFLLAAVSFVIYRTKRRSFITEAEQGFFPGRPRGLFDEQTSQVAPRQLDGVRDELVEHARRLHERAASGELETLREAWATGDRKLYDEVLGALLKRDTSSENILRVAEHVIRSNDGLRANDLLAGAMLTLWRISAEGVRAADLLRVAALSDDARFFGDVVEELVVAVERGRLDARAAGELRVLFESEHWVLSSEALRSGAGFMLKQQLAEARRRLDDASRRQSLSTEPGEV